MLASSPASIMNHCSPQKGIPDDSIRWDNALAFREVTGDFGTLVYNGPDWIDPGLGKRSMELMATEVMPRINEAIGA